MKKYAFYHCSLQYIHFVCRQQKRNTQGDQHRKEKINDSLVHLTVITKQHKGRRNVKVQIIEALRKK